MTHNKPSSWLSRGVFQLPHTNEGVSYRPEIDGLRAIAVVSVIGFHLGVQALSGGYLGVDAFFVISGYLITGILLTSITRGTFSYPRFLLKRARRLLPALGVMTITTALAAWVLFDADQLARFGASVMGVATYTSNVVFMLDNSYFQQSSATTPLLHTWSLGVEEQFYILVPLIVFLLFRFRQDVLRWVILALTVVSLVGWLWLRELEPSPLLADWAFYLLPLRAWELGAGALLALSMQGEASPIQGRVSREVLSWTGIGLMGGAFILGGMWSDRGVPSLVMVLAVVILLRFSPETGVGRILSKPVFVGIGLLSYGLYLWHYPLISFLKVHFLVEELTGWMFAAAIIFTFFFAMFSLRFIENPIRRGVDRPRRSVALVLGFVTVLSLLGLLSQVPAGERSPERDAARILQEHEWVYFGDLDEGLFQLERLSGPLPDDVTTIAVGSSRLMQLNSEVWGEPILNVSVSAANIADIYALAPSALARTGADRVVIGLDPWILNENSGQDPRSSLEQASLSWKRSVEQNLPFAPLPLEESDRNPEDLSIVSTVYEAINSSQNSLVPTTSSPELLAKRSVDGAHIYPREYSTMSQDDIEGEFDEILRREDMDNFEFREESLRELRDLVLYLRRNSIEVNFLLSPYHPGLYEEIEDSTQGFLDAEEAFRELSEELGVPIYGGYKPEVLGCSADDFFDGWHPRENCLTMLLAASRH